MSDITLPSSPLPLPAPRTPITVRPATLEDVPFMDALRKRHEKAVGWMPTEQLQAKVELGQVVVAVTGHLSVVTRGALPGRDGAEVLEDESLGTRGRAPAREEPASDQGQVTSDVAQRLGYAIASDRYMKREDVGI